MMMPDDATVAGTFAGILGSRNPASNHGTPVAAAPAGIRGTLAGDFAQKLTSARTPAISAGSADRSEGTTYCRSGVIRTADVIA